MTTILRGFYGCKKYLQAYFRRRKNENLHKALRKNLL